MSTDKGFLRGEQPDELISDAQGLNKENELTQSSSSLELDRRLAKRRKLEPGDSEDSVNVLAPVPFTSSSGEQNELLSAAQGFEDYEHTQSTSATEMAKRWTNKPKLAPGASVLGEVRFTGSQEAPSDFVSDAQGINENGLAHSNSAVELERKWTKRPKIEPGVSGDAVLDEFWFISSKQIMTCVLDRAGPPHLLSPTLPNDVGPSAEPIASSLKVEAQAQMLELRTSSRPRKEPDRFFDYVIKQEPGDSRPGCSKRTNGKSAAAKQGNEKSAAGKKKKERGKPREDRPPIRTTTVRSDNEFSYGVDFSALGFMKKNRSTRMKVELTYVHVSRMDRMIEHSEPVYKSGLRVDHEYLKSPNYSELSNETGYPIGAIVDSKVKDGVKLFRIYYFGYELNSQGIEWWQTKETFEQNGFQAYKTYMQRERIVKSIKSDMQSKHGAAFDEMFPEVHLRKKFEKAGMAPTSRERYNLHLQDVEIQMNSFLFATGQAPIFIENWTNHYQGINFQYLVESVYEYSLLNQLRNLERRKLPTARCNCTVNCVDCDCAGGSHHMACGDDCACPDDCELRTNHKKRKHSVILFYTGREKGWGLFAAENIPNASFMGHYTGMVILGDDLYKQAYDFDLEVRAGSLSMNLVVDANACGNETRYYNHACKPNLNAVKVYSSNQNVTHDISFMTNKEVSLGEELTFMYAKGVKKGVRCKCVPGCRKYMY